MLLLCSFYSVKFEGLKSAKLINIRPKLQQIKSKLLNIFLYCSEARMLSNMTREILIVYVVDKLLHGTDLYPALYILNITSSQYSRYSLFYQIHFEHDGAATKSVLTNLLASYWN